MARTMRRNTEIGNCSVLLGGIEPALSGMPRLYKHRINTIEALAAVPLHMGIEFDLRSDGQRVIVTHDPFTDGPTIEEFFPHIGQRPCIFNVKTEGIEERVMALAATHAISEFFFLDLSVPAAVKLWRAGERRIAVRYSELEPAEGVLAWADKASWVWVDCFTQFPPADAAWDIIASKFQVCLVSPELQRHSDEHAQALRASLAGRTYHAVCTKTPDRWGPNP